MAGRRAFFFPRLTSTVVNLHAEVERLRADVARLRLLALVPMAPGEVPTEDAGGWYVIRPIDDDGTTGALECVECWWDADGGMFYSGPDCGTCDPKDEPAVWLARIPVEALGESPLPPPGEREGQGVEQHVGHKEAAAPHGEDKPPGGGRG